MLTRAFFWKTFRYFCKSFLIQLQKIDIFLKRFVGTYHIYINNTFEIYIRRNELWFAKVYFCESLFRQNLFKFDNFHQFVHKILETVIILVLNFLVISTNLHLPDTQFFISFTNGMIEYNNICIIPFQNLLLIVQF